MFPPAPPEKVPILGNVPDFMKGPLAFFKKNEERYGDICALQSPFRIVCIVFKPEYVRQILQENHRNYKKSFGYDTLKILLGEGLLTSGGDFWIRQRRLAQPAFHKERLARLVDIMADCTEQVLLEWKTRYTKGSTVNISYEMNRLALLIVTRTLFQSHIREEDINRLNISLSRVIEEGAERIRNPFKLPLWVPTPGNFREKHSVREIKEIIGGLIRQRMNDPKRYDDLLDMLIHTRDEETGESMSAAQLLDEVMTIFIAGHETTANSLSFTWYLLARNPEEDAKLMKEIAEVLDGRKPTAEDMKRLTYTRQIIDESMRLYPPAWLVGRESISEDKFGDYTIPAGTSLGIPTYVIQRSVRNWNDPEKFRPERFAPENAGSIPKFAYFPFGGGPRLCIGNMFAIYEMITVVTIMRREFKLSLPENYTLELQPVITLRVKGKLEMIVN